ncbi:hypothetical protein OUHCRE21_46600 [Enterobacter hormaechei subsp. xiangfangensis]
MNCLPKTAWPPICLMQPWRFIRITEPALRRAIHGLVEVGS